VTSRLQDRADKNVFLNGGKIQLPWRDTRSAPPSKDDNIRKDAIMRWLLILDN
jgi:hypothetical protein